MKTSPILIVSFLSGFAVQSAFSQGALNPPVGAPAPTMKTLDQLDAKLETRIRIRTLPLTISAPGSYYLIADLTAPAAGSGIDITVDNVTLNLNGFSLIGPAAPGASSGITTANPRKNITVRNGTVRGWGTGGGVALNSATNSRAIGVSALSNGGVGIALGSACIVQNCVSDSNAGNGILVTISCVVENCTSVSNTGATSNGIQTLGAFQCVGG